MIWGGQRFLRTTGATSIPWCPHHTVSAGGSALGWGAGGFGWDPFGAGVSCHACALAAVPTPIVPGALVPAPLQPLALPRAHPAALREREVPGRHRGHCARQRLGENTKKQACAEPGEGVNGSGGAARREGWALTGGRRPWSLRSLSSSLLHFRRCFQPATDEISVCIYISLFRSAAPCACQGASCSSAGRFPPQRGCRSSRQRLSPL